MSYVIAGYAVAFATLAGYSGWVLSRRRRLARIFRSEDHRVAGS